MSFATMITLLVGTMWSPSLAEVQLQQLYFGYYDGLNAETAAYANLELASTPESAVAVHALGDHRIDVLLSVREIFFLGSGMHPDWQSRWSAMVPLSKKLIANGTIIGFNLGDELVWNCIPPSNVSAAAAAVRTDFIRGDAVIWYNEAAFFGKQSGWKDSCKNNVDHFKIPPELDWFSTDIYHMDGEVDGWVNQWVTGFYHKWIYPNLTNSQRALVVPGSFGSNVNHFPNGTYVCTNECYDKMCAHDAQDFYAWAKSDSRVVALAPWNWKGCESCNGSHWTPPHTCCMDEIGTVDQPHTRATWEQIGKEIIGLPM